MNEDLSPALAASNTVETLAPQTVQETVISQEMFKPEYLTASLEGFVEPEVQAEPSEPAPETERVMAGFVVAADYAFTPAEFVEITQDAPVARIVETIVEKIIHPEVGVTREKIDHRILTSHIKNPA